MSAPTRRGLLALALAPAAALVAPATAPATAAPHPDAELLAACATVRAAWRKLGELLEAAGDDDDAWDAAAELVAPESDAAVAVLLRARATTLDGIFARVAALAETAAHMLDPKWLEQGDDEVQRFALLRDLVAMASALASAPTIRA